MTGRARMFWSVNVARLILTPPSGSERDDAVIWRSHLVGPVLMCGGAAVSICQRAAAPEQCEFSGISHRDINMGLSAKVALRRR